ncbi:amidohydrolase [Bacillus sp. Marseille-P3661]|uniref:amidohydrolase n=1 Tax=Bacillus sp. Marseille-P3661 TaxID=1936234 RepID=UPI002155A540|nr:amidohydrolase [Bacillus sp. Marseille-P3661]
MMNLLKGLESLEKELIELRRDFHRYPESGWLEYRTSAKIASLLESYGYKVYVGKDAVHSEARMGVPNEDVLKLHEERAISEGVAPKWLDLMKGGHTGVVGVIQSPNPGPVVALRFDIDSLDILESKADHHVPVQKGFRSVHEGMMHACGHDGHAAIGLGVAKLLMENVDRLHGEVRLLFQPAEEGVRGAKAMVEKGWLDGVDYFYSGHIAFQSFKLGEIVATVGGFLATTKLDVTYKGQAAHAGDKPENGRNALLAAASASLHLHGISRHSQGKTRINVGKLNAGSGRNVIPDYATMAIETRGETTKLNEYMTKEAIRIIENMAKVYDVECEWKVAGQAPGAQSNEELIPFIQSEIEAVSGVTSLVSNMDLNGSEDAVYMINRVQEQGGKASYLLFGSPIPAGHHDPLFDINEDVLKIGSEILTRLVLSSEKLNGGH